MFLCAAIVIYPGLISLKMGICLLVLLIIYSIVSFIMFFIKRPGEQFNVLNNIVLCFLHIYFCFIAYKYQSISGTLGDINDSYFSLNTPAILLPGINGIPRLSHIRSLSEISFSPFPIRSGEI